MLSDSDFQDKSADAIEDLEERLLPVSDEHDFEVESARGILTIFFAEPTPSKFIISPNGPARQIWVSALSTSYKFDWDDASGSFVLDKTREAFRSVIAGLIARQLGSDIQL